jgi:hypothetical protein
MGNTGKPELWNVETVGVGVSESSRRVPLCSRKMSDPLLPPQSATPAGQHSVLLVPRVQDGAQRHHVAGPEAVSDAKPTAAFAVGVVLDEDAGVSRAVVEPHDQTQARVPQRAV